jgi:hypothetical protein
MSNLRSYEQAARTTKKLLAVLFKLQTGIFPDVVLFEVFLKSVQFNSFFARGLKFISIYLEHY